MDDDEFSRPADAPLGQVGIEILKRMALPVAPEAIFFRATTDGFAAADARSDTDYDPARHDLRYVWSFGDPGAMSDKVENLPRTHNDLNCAYGKDVAHVFTRPGRYRIRCAVRDEDGRWGTDETEIEIAPAASVYGGARTILVDPAGRGSPDHPGARVVSDLPGALAALETAQQGAGRGQPARILLPRGARIEAPSSDLRGRGTVLIGAWGSATAPPRLLHRPGGSAASMFHAHGRFRGDLILQGLDLQGGWDSTTERGVSANAVETAQDGGRTVLIDDCRFSGFGLALESRRNRDGDPTMTVIHNSAITNWRNFGYYLATNPQAFGACIGSRVAQHPQALMGGGGRNRLANDHGGLRTTEMPWFYMGVCDFFSRNGWTRIGEDRIPVDQACLRWNTARAPGGHAQIERTAFEGGFAVIAQDYGGGGTVAHHGDNLVIEKCLIVGTARSIALIDITSTGVTIRNNLMVKPDAPFATNNWRAAVWCVPEDGDLQAPRAPVRVYSNTVVNALSPAHTDADLDVVAGIEGFEVFNDENNVLYAPGRPGAMAEDPLLDTAPLPCVAGPWRSRYAGIRFRGYDGGREQLEMDTRFATALGAVPRAVPEARSPLVADGRGLAAIDDFSGRIRPPLPTRGAREPD